MDSITAVEIRQTLEREYEIFLTPKDIRSMTLARLKDIQEELLHEDSKKTEKSEEPSDSIKLVFRIVGDESESTIEEMPLASRLPDGEEGPLVFALPGIEGFIKVMRKMAAGMDARVVGLQYVYDRDFETFQDMVRSLVSVIQKRIPSKSTPIRLLSYSYGTAVALEVAHALESLGYATGTVVLIDGSPTMVAEVVKQIIFVGEEHVFQMMYIRHVMSFYLSPDVFNKHHERILKCNSLEERIKMAIEIITSIVPLENPDYYHLLVKTIFKRLSAFNAYTPSYTKIKSKICLIKPTQATLKHFPEDMNCSQLSEQPLTIETFEGNHITILDSEKVIQRVNWIFCNEN